MKPRQTSKNFHHNTNLPPYQNQNSSTPTTTLKDIDLIKLGLNPEVMPFLKATQNNAATVASSNVSGNAASAASSSSSGSGGVSNLSNQEEIIKCLQAFYGKNSADILHNLPALNDWPMQSVSPPDYSRVFGGGAESGDIIVGSDREACFRNIGGGGSGATITNNNINNNSGQQNQQDSQHSTKNSCNNANSGGGSSQKHSSSGSNSHSQQIPSSTAITNHFKISSLNTHLPQQHLSQQQKSVLSLHQHHQNDSSNNRRLNHHNLSTSNASITNLNSITNASNVPSTSSQARSDSTNSLNNSNNLNSSNNSVKNSSMSNIMDSIGSVDNMFFDNSLPINKNISSNKHQSTISSSSLTRHQQLQKLLRATGTSNKSNTSTSVGLPHRNDLRNNQSISSSSIPQHLSSSHQTSVINPSHAAFSSVPKSLLNLAACSSTTPDQTGGSSSLASITKFSNMVNQLNLKSIRNNSTSTVGGNQSNSTSGLTSSNKLNNNLFQNETTNSLNDSFKGPTNIDDHNNKLLLQMNKTANTISSNITNNSRVSTRQSSASLLLGEQNISNNNNRTMCNINHSSSLISAKPQSHIQKSTPVPSTSKEAYIASLQERGISIGEIQPANQTNNTTSPLASTTNASCSNNSATSNILTQQNIANLVSSGNQTKEEFVNVADRKEIESALSRVEARNDLSLLYPPVLLGSNSQKQINALSAGLHNSDESEIFTQQVKRIVLEECNIIYECKECRNLFRSLANLVKHKRSYCPDYNPERLSNIEMNKRSYDATNNEPNEQTLMGNSNNTVTFIGDLTNQNTANELNLFEPQQQQSNDNASVFSSLELDNDSSLLDNCNNSNDLGGIQLNRRMKMIQDKKKIDQDNRFYNNKRRNNNSILNETSLNSDVLSNIHTTETSLSKLLQTQPKNRMPVSRDSALIGALNMSPIATIEAQSINNALNCTFSNYENDKNSNSELITEQLVQNSSLAKTLLNEKASRQSARQLNQRLQQQQSLLGLSTSPEFIYETGTTKRVAAPKRKFLEDCIQKVKRDKCLNEDEEQEVSNTKHETSGNDMDTNDNQQGDDYVEGDNSKFSSLESDDSNMLTIDLEEPKKINSGTKRVKRRISTAASSTTSSTSSVSKLTSSSALLKALTRPVDTKKSNIPTNVQPMSVSPSTSAQDKNTITDLEANSPEVEDSSQVHSPKRQEPPKSNSSQINHPQTDHITQESHPEPDNSQPNLTNQDVLTSDPTQDNDQLKSNAPTTNRSPNHNENMEEVEVLSPLFDKYTCDICEDDYKDLETLMKHSVEKHNNEKMVYPCIFCSLSFITLENVCRHIIDIHKKPRAQVQRLKEVVRSRSFLSSDFIACSDYPVGQPIEPMSDTKSERESNNRSSSRKSILSTLNSSPSHSGGCNSSSGTRSRSDSNSSNSTNAGTGSDSDSSSVSGSGSESSSSSSSGSGSSSSSPNSRSRSSSNSSTPSSSPMHATKETTSPAVAQIVKSDVPQPSSIHPQSSSSVANVSLSESTSSTNSAGGGIMKLKIQLKTRPDEKSKVYEIV